MKAFCQRCCNFLSEGRRELLLNIGLLFLRVAVGGIMLWSHGWPKLMSFSIAHTNFPDPLGVGSTVSMVLAVGAEVFCSILLIIGLATRLAAIPLCVTMLVAAFIVHGADPWQKKEFAIMYLIPFLTLILTGAGRFSLDARCSRTCSDK